MDERKGFLSRRVTLKGWQKLLIVLGCTLLAAAASWLYCEKIASPVYTTSVRAQLRILDTESLASSGDASLTKVTLDIPAGLRDELAAVGSGSKGLFYRNISDDIKASTGELMKPKELKNMISVAADAADADHRTVFITVKNSDPTVAETIAGAAGRQFSTLVFGTADAEGAEITREETDEANIVRVVFRVKEEAVSSLPDRFLGKTLDLVTPVKNYLADAAFCEEAAARAGLSGKGNEVRNKVSMATTADPAELTLRASWTDPEGAKNLVTAIGQALADRIFGGTAEVWQVAVDEPVVLSENVKEWPRTGLIVALVTLIALIVSYALFSQQPLFDTVIVIFFILFTFICVFPFYYLFINTISDNNLVAGGQINFLPQGIHFGNYSRILGQEELKNALVVTVGRTILGTALMVLTSAWAGYLVTKRKMWHRSFWYRALVVTMYFNAGLIPWYTNMLMLGLTGNFLAYIIPGMVAPYNIILVKTYIESIPGSLEESAIIDGASTSKVFLRIILPLSIPILATISIFGAVGNWNSFQDSLLLMSSTPNLYTLQHRLYVYLNQTTSINTEQISEQMAQNLLNNGITTKYTIAMVTIIPILLVYPFMQRYFVKGIMLGAVKG